MNMFLAAGDVLFNPALLNYAIVETDSEGLHLRLGFGDSLGKAPSELRLHGLEARSILRWLRGNTEFLDSGSSTLHRNPRPIVTQFESDPHAAVNVVRQPGLAHV